jgi:hypothetical protein
MKFSSKTYISQLRANFALYERQLDQAIEEARKSKIVDRMAFLCKMELLQKLGRELSAEEARYAVYNAKPDKRRIAPIEYVTQSLLP